MPRSAIARSLRTPGVWPGRSQLISDVEQSERGTFFARRSLGLDPYGLLMEAHRLSQDHHHPSILESDLFEALVNLAPKDVPQLGVQVEKMMAELRATEPPEPSLVPPAAKRSIFVAYPWSAYEDRAGYKAAFTSLESDLGVQFVFAESQLSERHVLDKIEEMIKGTSFGIYDLTRWNPNVSLEYGYARGIGQQAFIAFNPTVGESTDVPADIRGYDRVQYENFADLSSEVRRLVLQQFGPKQSRA